LEIGGGDCQSAKIRIKKILKRWFDLEMVKIGVYIIYGKD